MVHGSQYTSKFWRLAPVALLIFVACFGVYHITVHGIGNLGDVPLMVGAIGTSSVSGWLKRQYATKSWFKPYQNDLVPMLEDLDECPDEAPEGSGWFVPLFVASGQNWRAGAEGSVTSDVVAPIEQQGQVNAQEFKGTVQLTEFLKRAGSAKGHFNGGALAQQMKSVTTDLMKAMQRFFVIGAGTGRLAIVDATTVATNQFVCRLPLRDVGLGRNMRFDVYDTDTAGTIQLTNRTITAIDRSTFGITGAGAINTFAGTVTYSGAAGSLTAGWSVYRSGDYGGNITNGIRNLIQDGTISSSFLGVTYATEPGLKANVLSNSGTPRAYSEELMRTLVDQIWQVGGGTVESLRLNSGVMNEVAGVSTPDKRYPVMKGDFPKYVQGWREGDLVFAYDKATAVFKKDPQIPARTIYAINFKDSFYKHTLAEMGFLDKGGQDGVLHLTPNGTSFETSWTAVLYAACNISCYNPAINGALFDLMDSGLAGD